MTGRDHPLTDEETETQGGKGTFSKLSTVWFHLAWPHKTLGKHKLFQHLG